MRSMRSDDFYTSKMDGLRPIFAQELTGDVSDPSTVAFALNKYLKSAEDFNYMK